MDNEIYEMAKNICECFGGRASYSVCGDCYEARNSYRGCSGLAEGLYDKGYRKQVWHKVAGGDLPKKVGQYLCKNKTGSYCCLNYSLIDNAFLEQDTMTKDFYVTNKVVAWTELPEYEEDTKCNYGNLCI